MDTKVGAAILQNPKNTGVMGTDVSIRRNGEKHPPKIMAVGEFTFLTSKKQFVYGNLPLNIKHMSVFTLKKQFCFALREMCL